MEQQSIVRDIERRAKASRISIAELCRRAGISPDTFFKWRKTPRNPDPVGANLHSVEALYRELAKIDAEDAQRLARRGKKAVAA
ncbi:transposase [Erythrobacter sp. NE805]|uniref:transposase n=1 Tax=Erythrobacter sp. NE805 TaxID=3389875 RepID=UPI00396B1BA1